MFTHRELRESKTVTEDHDEIGKLLGERTEQLGCDQKLKNVRCTISARYRSDFEKPTVPV